MTRFVALLRGINVGGNNIIKMTALKECFEAQGFSNVATFIQSGNVIFEAPAARGLATRLETMLTKTFGYAATVVLRSQQQMRAIIEGAPDGFGARPAKFRYDVIFLKEPLTAAAALRRVPAKPGVDEVHAGRGVLYFSRLISKATQSHLRYIIAQPIYQSVTIRNFNTTRKLFQLLEARAR